MRVKFQASPSTRSSLPLPSFWLALSIGLVFFGLGTLFQARTRATTHPTTENLQQIRSKSGRPDLYVDPRRYQPGVILVAVGMVSTMGSAWVWGQRADARRGAGY